MRGPADVRAWPALDVGAPIHHRLDGQIGRYAHEDWPEPRAAVAPPVAAWLQIVRMISAAYDAETAKAWLFRTNTRLDDHAPIEMLRAAEAPEQFTAIVRAARQLASFQT